MTYTMEADAEAETRRRSGAIDGRYQICDQDGDGLIATADTRADAFDIADRYALRKLPDGSPYCADPYRIEVYDRMARMGQSQTWRRQPKNVGTYCLEHGDYYSMDGRWKCIEKRGKTRRTDDLTSRLWS